VPTLSDRARDVALSVVLGGLALSLYVATMCRTIFWYDSAEFVAAAVFLGIPHPPGYPLYTIIGHVFTWLPLEPALAVNLMSAVFGALTVALAYWVIRSLGGRAFGASVGAAALGTSPLFWSQSLIAEVYTPGLAFLLGVILLLLSGLKRNCVRRVVAAAGLAGLGLGVHLFLATCGLGLAFMVACVGLPIEVPGDLRLVVSRESLSRRAKVAASCVGAVIIGACIFLWIPIRASMKPVLNFGDVTTVERFVWLVTGGNYRTWFYGSETLIQRTVRVGGFLYEELLIVGITLAGAGLLWLFRRRAHLALAFALMIAGNLWFFFDYQVHDAEVFFLPSITMSFLLVGLGVDATLGWASRVVRPERRRAVTTILGVTLLALPLSALAANYERLDLSDYAEPQEYLERLGEELPHNAIILNFTTPPEWVVEAVFSHYYQKVKGGRPDVVVASGLDVPAVVRLLELGKPVYLFVRVETVAELFQLEEEGLLLRVVAFDPQRPPDIPFGSAPP
jgi:hypothetical protein